MQIPRQRNKRSDCTPQDLLINGPLELCTRPLQFIAKTTTPVDGSFDGPNQLFDFTIKLVANAFDTLSLSLHRKMELPELGYVSDSQPSFRLYSRINCAT